MERRDYLKKIKILIVLIVIFSIAVPLYFGGKGFISPILNKSSIGEVFAKGNSIRDEELIARAINGEARGEPSTSDWIWSRTIVKEIGKHNFGK